MFEVMIDDFDTQTSLVVGEKDENGEWIVRHAVRLDGKQSASIVAAGLRRLADWLDEPSGYQKWIEKYHAQNFSRTDDTVFGDQCLGQGSGASKGLPQNEPVSGNEADNGTVQGLGSGSHDSIMRWRPGRS